jgi:hypothetical protein
MSTYIDNLISDSMIMSKRITMFGKHKKVLPMSKESLLWLLSVEEHYLVGNSYQQPQPMSPPNRLGF